jgi:shikimate kinase
MGAGKSTVGPLLAERLAWPFIDLDETIAGDQRRSIREIFEREGEAHFRALETATIEALGQRTNSVVALGGGAFSQAGNVSLIRRLGTSVFLDCSFEQILERCPIDGTRPLFRDTSQVRRLYEARLPDYRNSDFRVDVSDLDPKYITEIIVGKLFGSAPTSAEVGTR